MNEVEAILYQPTVRMKILFLFFVIFTFFLIEIYFTTENNEIEADTKLMYLASSVNAKAQHLPLNVEVSKQFKNLKIPLDKGYVAYGQMLGEDLKELFYFSNFTITSTHLGFSPQKSGTTALTWIAMTALDALRNKSNSDEILYSVLDGGVLVNMNKKEALMFTPQEKHDYVIIDCGESVTNYNESNNNKKLNDYFETNDLSPLTLEGLSYLKNYVYFTEKVKKEYKCKSKQVILFRDPIEGAFSWLKYKIMPINITLRNTKFDEYCKRLVLHAGISWQYFKVIYKDRKDINYIFLYYKDLIEDKENFVKKFLNIMEISVPDEIIENVMERTSFKFMKEVQRQINLEKNDETIIAQSIKNFYHGLSSKGANSRKVSDKSVTLENSIKPETLEKCRNYYKKYMPQELIDTLKS